MASHITQTFGRLSADSRQYILGTILHYYLCVNLRNILFLNQGRVLAATQRLKQLSQMSSTADERHSAGNHGEGESEMLQRGRVEFVTQAYHTTRSNWQQGLSLVQKMQNDPVLQTSTDPGKQVLCYF